MREKAAGRRLVLLVLGVLQGAPLHGYGIVRRIADDSQGVLAPAEGLLYPLLHDLEGAGLIASTWETHAGRRRKVYTLTPDGARRYQEEFRLWQAETQAVAGVLRVKEGETRLALG